MNNKKEIEGELTTQALATALGKSPQVVFQQLVDMGLIVRNGDTWDLTAAGKLKGGLYKGNKYGQYPVWPPSIKAEFESPQQDIRIHSLTSTEIGKHFEKSAERINSILSELGLIKKDIKGWQATELGIRLGAIQSEVKTSGVPYVRWPESIINNKILINSIGESKGDIQTTSPNQTENTNKEDVEFRNKFPADYRAKDGHCVRSKSELLIDNFLYESKLVHAYERKLPIEEDQYCDFYIPTQKVYIEYWGLADDPQYSARKDKKLEIYKKHGFKLIELTDKEVQNLDDTLPKLLLKFGITTE